MSWIILEDMKEVDEDIVVAQLKNKFAWVGEKNETVVRRVWLTLINVNLVEGMDFVLKASRRESHFKGV